jgi:hypothetical protein
MDRSGNRFHAPRVLFHQCFRDSVICEFALIYLEIIRQFSYFRNNNEERNRSLTEMQAPLRRS